MKNTEIERTHVSATINPSVALIQALIVAKAILINRIDNYGVNFYQCVDFKIFYAQNKIREQPNLNWLFQKRYSSMKCANAFTKGHLNVCPAKDITGKKCNYRGRFAEPSKSRNKRPPVKFVNDNLVNNKG